MNKKRKNAVTDTELEAGAKSARVWQFLENDAPGFNEAVDEGAAQIAAGKSMRLSAVHAKKDRGRG